MTLIHASDGEWRLHETWDVQQTWIKYGGRDTNLSFLGSAERPVT